MKERSLRLRAIKTILKTETIDSQEALLSKLSDSGIIVTQATLSRDLKLLKVAKISDGSSGYYYSLSGDDQNKNSNATFIQDILRGFLSIDFSGNIGVLHTIPGHADSVAFALDNLQLPAVLGTMAGDDTILIILKEKFSPGELLSSLRQFIPELEL